VTRAEDGALIADAARTWDDEVMPVLCEYVAVPAVSSAYDAQWEEHGHVRRAAELMRDWCLARPVRGMSVELLERPGVSPVLLIEVAASDPALATDTVLLYGHLDKQPEMTGWREGLGPWTPVVENGRLYGRGGADDGYAVFASLVAIEAAQRNGVPHARCVVLIEASEESGSVDLPGWLEVLGDRLGTPSLVVCLDSGCLDYGRMWVTTSLRGLADVVLRVDVLEEGVHSGEASGVVPSSFRILRELLDRVEDSGTGRILVPEMHAPVPAHRIAEAHATADEFPDPIHTHYPLAGGTRPMTEDPAGQILARTWHPTVSYTGIDGMPPIERAGNVLRPHTSVRLSFRLPPGCDSVAALDAVARILGADPPSGARVTVERGQAADGWDARPHEPWLSAALDAASHETFGSGARAFGEGGSIPFIGMLADRFPAAQFVVTGVLGPGSNAHGPNEFMDVATARRLTACISRVLGAHASRPAR
jgi:acetylornithine deacetylase/succinyl-diaminopimelate desuccinylase-like protein